MSRIISQDSHPNLALNYENILACCTGNEATQGTKQIEDTHCDVKKGSKDFHFNPANIDEVIVPTGKDIGGMTYEAAAELLKDKL